MNALRPVAAIWLLSSVVVSLQAQTQAGPIPEQGQPAKLPWAFQYDFTSRVSAHNRGR
jgi:hypothetical protein